MVLNSQFHGFIFDISIVELEFGNAVSLAVTLLGHLGVEKLIKFIFFIPVEELKLRSEFKN